MNEETQTVEVKKDTNLEMAKSEQVSEKPQDEKKYTDADVDKIIDKKFAKWKKELKAEQAEAEKTRNMTEKDKAIYDAKKQSDRIAELEAQINRNNLEKEASKMLSEAGIVSSEDVLDFVVGTDEEQTVSRVNAFTKLVKDIADKQVSEMLKGKTPTRTENQAKGLTKADFNKMSYAQRVHLKQTDSELYNQLKGN